MRKTKLKKNIIFQSDVLKIGSDKTPIGLYGEGKKLNQSEEDP